MPLLLVLRPGATSSVLAPISDAAMPFATSSFLLLVVSLNFSAPSVSEFVHFTLCQCANLIVDTSTQKAEHLAKHMAKQNFERHLFGSLYTKTDFKH